MDTKINGRTPEEIKRGLGYYAETNLAKKLNAYKQDLKYWYAEDVAADALAYIQQLECERDELLQENEQLKHESDMAVLDLEMCCPCEVCTRSCKYDKVNAYDECADFEWRGVQEVENNACQKGFDGLS